MPDQENLNNKKTSNPKTFQVRKECIKRKAMELSTLCDIKVCTIITSPEGELQTWPENLQEVRAVLDLYTQTQSTNKRAKQSQQEEKKEEEKEGEKDIVTLVESKLEAVNNRIRYLESKNAGNIISVSKNKGKGIRIE